MNASMFKNVLVVRPGSLGDTVATFPVFYSLKKASYKVYLIGSEKMIEYIEKIKLIEKGIGFGDISLLGFFTNQKKFDIPGMPTFDIVICYIEKDNIFAQNILNTYPDNTIFHPVPEEPPYHITEFLLEPLGKLGIETTSEINKQTKSIGDIIFIHPGSGSKKKNLPPEYFLEIFSELKQICQCKIIIGECEKPDKNWWIKNAGIENIIELESICELAQRIENGLCFLGNDSGVSHLSAFLGLNTFIFFGPTNPNIWAPRGSKVIIIKTLADCAPCDYQTRKQCVEVRCLQEIKPQYIISLMKQKIMNKGGQ